MLLIVMSCTATASRLSVSSNVLKYPFTSSGAPAATRANFRESRTTSRPLNVRAASPSPNGSQAKIVPASPCGDLRRGLPQRLHELQALHLRPHGPARRSRAGGVLRPRSSTAAGTRQQQHAERESRAPHRPCPHVSALLQPWPYPSQPSPASLPRRRAPRSRSGPTAPRRAAARPGRAAGRRAAARRRPPPGRRRTASSPRAARRASTSSMRSKRCIRFRVTRCSSNRSRFAVIRPAAVAHHAARRPRSQSDSSMRASAGIADAAASRRLRERPHALEERDREREDVLVPHEAARRPGRVEAARSAARRRRSARRAARVDRVAQPAAGDRRVLADDAVGERRRDRLGLVEEAEVAELLEQRRDQPAVEHAVEVLLAEDLPRGAASARARRGRAARPAVGRGTAGRSSSHAASNRGSSVSVSRRAGPPHDGHSHSTKSRRSPRFSPALRSAGSRTGSRSRGTGTAPHRSQRTTGTGAPHGPGREIGGSDAR